MNLPDYTFVVTSHMEHFGWRDLGGKVELELGPGDSLFTAVIARAFGGRSTHLVDGVALASDQVEPYLALAQYLRRKGLQSPPIDNSDSVPVGPEAR